MKSEYIIKLGIPKARLDEDPKVLDTIEEKIGLEAIKERHIYGLAKTGLSIFDILLLSPTIESFGPGKDIAFYSFRVTDIILQRREDFGGMIRILERSLGDLVSYDTDDMSKGLVKGMQPYKISGTDIPMDEPLIEQDKRLTKKLLEEKFFAARPDIDYIGYSLDEWDLKEIKKAEKKEELEGKKEIKWYYYSS